MSSDKNRPVVLITGASSGIGEALAIEYSRCGADLILAARRERKLKTLAERLSGDGTRAVFSACDVTKDGDLERVVLMAQSTFSKIDIVIANAGFGVKGALEEISLSDYRRQFETNVFGVLRTIYATLDALKKSRGRLVIIGSVMGHIASPDASAYAMSKFAMRALCESIRLELAPYDVSVTLISPGFVASEFRQVDNMGKVDETRKETAPKALLMEASQAAQQIARAIKNRKHEAIITAHGKIAVFLRNNFPEFVSAVLARVREKTRSGKDSPQKVL
ncbi:MAG: SDR family NAD(P)-dependent oxidoreductase [Nitrospirae bacterium]|nr:SDR family NAD(P)-dependent oxidoreductase [Candidatus Troglogloeales bacterium]